MRGPHLTDTLRDSVGTTSNRTAVPARRVTQEDQQSPEPIVRRRPADRADWLHTGGTAAWTHISRLTPNNFRNFASLELELPPSVVVLYGFNAPGKTTLLEAVYLLAIARSFRTENEREVVNLEAARQEQQAVVGGTLNRAGERVAIDVGYQPTSTRGNTAGPARLEGSLNYSVRKQIRVNPIHRTAAELVGTIGAVLFSVDDIELVQGPPARRRRYLDILISQSNPLYLKALQRYRRVVQQRNRLPRLLQEGRAEGAELEFWDSELVQEGTWLTWQRGDAISVLAELCAQHHQDLGSPGQHLSMQHRPSIALGKTEEETRAGFEGTLARLRRRELATGQTPSDRFPHRDDSRDICSPPAGCGPLGPLRETAGPHACPDP